MATTRIIWTGDSANAPAVANNLYGIDQDTADRLVAALKSADAKRLEIRDDGHLWQVGADGTSIDIGLVNDTGALENVVIGKGAEAGATAENVVAVGANAQADWRQSTAVGFRAAADGTCAVAVGAGASGSGSDAVAVGDVASASARDATAVGASAVAGAEHATAVGEGAEARHSFAVALGSGSVTDADNTVSVGSGVDNGTGSSPAVRRITHVGDPVADTDAATKAYADSCRFTVKGEGEDSVAISVNGDAESPGLGSIAIGRNAHTDAVSSQSLANYSIAIGSNAAVGHGGSVVIGGKASIRAQGSGPAGVIIGANARGDRSAISIGTSAGNNGIDPTQVHGVSIGHNALAFFDRSVALGAGARATASDQYHGCIALGGDATASAIGSVALGEQSKATEPYTVSVGEGVGSGDLPYRVATRRIVNVGDPKGGQDAATKAYVDSHAYVLPAATAGTLGGVKAGGNLTVADDGTLSVPTATLERYGVVKPGAGLAISANNYLIVRPATSSIIGGVKIGAGINVSSDGTINVQALVDRIAALESKVAALEAK